MLCHHQGEVFAYIYVAKPRGRLCANIEYGLYGRRKSMANARSLLQMPRGKAGFACHYVMSVKCSYA